MFTAAVLAAASAVAAPVPQGVDAKLLKEVAAARGKAIDFLKGKQDADGRWEKGGDPLWAAAGMEGGPTGLVTLALLEAGVPAADPAVAKAVGYVAGLPAAKTYVVSLQTRVLVRADRKAHAKVIQRNADWLLDKAVRDGEKRLLGWSYPGNTMTDGSNTHYAVLALHAAAEGGAKVDPKIWADVRGLYVRTKQDRGWGYMLPGDAGSPPTASMTVAGLIGLHLAGKHDPSDAGREAFEKALAGYVDRRPAGTKAEGYLLMAVAELGRSLGKPTFAAGKKEIAWYREGAEKLVKEQTPAGTWAFGKGSLEGNEVLSTAFALYFLGSPEKK